MAIEISYPLNILYGIFTKLELQQIPSNNDHNNHRITSNNASNNSGSNISNNNHHHNIEIDGLIERGFVQCEVICDVTSIYSQMNLKERLVQINRDEEFINRNFALIKNASLNSSGMSENKKTNKENGFKNDPQNEPQNQNKTPIERYNSTDDNDNDGMTEQQIISTTLKNKMIFLENCNRQKQIQLKSHISNQPSGYSSISDFAVYSTKSTTATATTGKDFTPVKKTNKNILTKSSIIDSNNHMIIAPTSSVKMVTTTTATPANNITSNNTNTNNTNRYVKSPSVNKKQSPSSILDNKNINNDYNDYDATDDDDELVCFTNELHNQSDLRSESDIGTYKTNSLHLSLRSHFIPNPSKNASTNVSGYNSPLLMVRTSETNGTNVVPNSSSSSYIRPQPPLNFLITPSTTVDFDDNFSSYSSNYDKDCVSITTASAAANYKYMSSTGMIVIGLEKDNNNKTSINNKNNIGSLNHSQHTGTGTHTYNIQASPKSANKKIISIDNMKHHLNLYPSFCCDTNYGAMSEDQQTYDDDVSSVGTASKAILVIPPVGNNSTNNNGVGNNNRLNTSTPVQLNGLNGYNMTHRNSISSHTMTLHTMPEMIELESNSNSNNSNQDSISKADTTSDPEMKEKVYKSTTPTPTLTPVLSNKNSNNKVNGYNRFSPVLVATNNNTKTNNINSNNNKSTHKEVNNNATNTATTITIISNSNEKSNNKDREQQIEVELTNEENERIQKMKQTRNFFYHQKIAIHQNAYIQSLLSSTRSEFRSISFPGRSAVEDLILKSAEGSYNLTIRSLLDQINVDIQNMADTFTTLYYHYMHNIGFGQNINSTTLPWQIDSLIQFMESIRILNGKVLSTTTNSYDYFYKIKSDIDVIPYDDREVVLNRVLIKHQYGGDLDYLNNYNPTGFDDGDEETKRKEDEWRAKVFYRNSSATTNTNNDNNSNNNSSSKNTSGKDNITVNNSNNGNKVTEESEKGIYDYSESPFLFYGS